MHKTSAIYNYMKHKNGYNLSSCITHLSTVSSLVSWSIRPASDVEITQKTTSSKNFISFRWLNFLVPFVLLLDISESEESFTHKRAFIYKQIKACMHARIYTVDLN